MPHPSGFATAPLFFVDLFVGVLRFPLWWYSSGLVLMLRWAGNSIKNQMQNLGLDVWVKNLFVPMYGTTDVAGRLISFFLRLVMIIGRSIMLSVWMLLVCLVLIFYLLILPISILGLAYHLGLDFLYV